MISHEHKVIFIHIPKCAGSSIEYYFNVKPFDWRKPNFYTLCGWDSKRKIHLQHATAKQYLELELIDEKTWHQYFKFAFVRNPWSRAYSDYFWIMKDTGIRDTFQNFILKKGKFSEVLNDFCKKEYRGDHLTSQTEFITVNGEIAVDFIGRFETFNQDFEKVRKILRLNKPMNFHAKKSKKRHKHYSHYFSNSKKLLIEKQYSEDISTFNYEFIDRRAQLNIFQQFILKKS